MTKIVATLSQAKFAAKYAREGLKVFPVYAATKGRCTCAKGKLCGSPGKHPMTPAGLKDASSDHNVVANWWKATPAANIGVLCGPESGLIVLDIDPRNGGDKTLAELEKVLGSLPRTLMVKTGGGGQHLLFRYPDFDVRKDNSGRLLGNGIDVLSVGSYFVAPGSMHVSGRRYVWRGRQKAVAIAKLPDGWLAQLRSGATSALPVAASASLSPSIEEGSRNNKLTSIAGGLRRQGVEEAQIEVALTAVNGVQCSPPLPAEEIRAIVSSVSKYAAPAPDDDIQAFAQLVLDNLFAGGAHILANGKNLWVFNGKFWAMVHDTVLLKQILDIFNQSPKRKTRDPMPALRQILDIIKVKVSGGDDPLSLKKQPLPVINCANGELWLVDGKAELRAHDYRSYQTTCLPVEWDPEATCVEYERALEGIFARNKVMIRHWHEIVGYLIQPTRLTPLVLILWGEGSNGKTALMGAVTSLMGTDMVSSISIESLNRSQFVMAGLVGKRMVLDDDVRAGVRLPDGDLKKLSEEKELTAEPKFGHPFNFIGRAVPVLLCNNVPSIGDLSYGMQRRLMVLPFKARFEEDAADKELFVRIKQNELAGVLKKSVEGYLRIVQRKNNFKKPKAVKRAENVFLMHANPVAAFFDECCEKAPGTVTRTVKLYQAYKAWAVEAGVTLTQQKLAFRRNLENLGFKAGRVNSGQTLIGLRLKSESQDDSIDEVRVLVKRRR